MIDLAPGAAMRRVDLHDTYGGRRQGGISPSKQTPNVFLFSEPAKGILHGYLYDGWRDDGLYHYTGEGQLGDQRMVQGNRAVRDHLQEGRDLHVFEVRHGQAVHLGRFEYVDDYPADAPETGGGQTRKVIVFRLRPSNDVAPGPNRSKIDALGTERVKEVPVEQHLTERSVIDGTREPYEAERREQALVLSFMAELLAQGHDVCRLQLRPDGEPAPIFCDLFDKTTNTVVEAKGSVARPALRMAVGQLADYARLVVPPPNKLILVPERPRQDLLDLATSQAIDVVWPEGDGFAQVVKPRARRNRR